MNQLFINLLWKEVLNKIKSEWQEKYTEYGTLGEIDQQSNLSKAIASDMKKSLKKKVSTWNSINNYLNADGFPSNAKDRTLHIFSEYLGYKDFEDFKEKNKDKVIEEEEKPRVFYERKYLYLLLGIMMALVSFLLIDKLFTTKAPKKENILNNFEKERAEITALIDRANNFEYNLYATAPNIRDTTFLTEYFTHNGQARKNIIDVLKRTKEKKHRLDRSKSSRSINLYDVKILPPLGDTMLVETIEHWKLLWRDSTSTNIVADYEATNIQKYYLLEREDGWLIDKNVYVGKAKRFPAMNKKTN